MVLPSERGTLDGSVLTLKREINTRSRVYSLVCLNHFFLSRVSSQTQRVCDEV